MSSQTPLFNDIKNQLLSHYSDSEYHTHVSMIEPKGRFQFNRNDFSFFLSDYCEYVSSKNENSVQLGIAEKPQNFLPILVDVDIKFPYDENVKYGKHI